MEGQSVTFLCEEGSDQEKRAQVIADCGAWHCTESNDWFLREGPNQEQSLENRGAYGKVDVSEFQLRCVRWF